MYTCVYMCIYIYIYTCMYVIGPLPKRVMPISKCPKLAHRHRLCQPTTAIVSHTASKYTVLYYTLLYYTILSHSGRWEGGTSKTGV